MIKRFIKKLCCLLAFVVTHASAQTLATCNNFGHFDLYVDIDPPAADGGVFVLDAAGEFAREAGTNTILVPADFRDFQGGVHKTDDPGWVLPPGAMLSASDRPSSARGELLWFRGLGSLQFWDKNQKLWTAPPNGERVRYFGEIPPDVALNGTPEEQAFYREGTIWSASGIAGPDESFIEEFVGGIHAHLDFCVEDSAGDCKQPGSSATGSPTLGAYMIELQLFSREVGANGRLKYVDSAPVKMILNNGLVANECSEAIEALVVPNTIVDNSPALPAAGILIMDGP